MKHTLLLWSLVAAAPAVAADNYRPRVGEPHRSFVLPDIQTGRAVSLSDYAGKKVLLIHFASW